MYLFTPLRKGTLKGILSMARAVALRPPILDIAGHTCVHTDYRGKCGKKVVRGRHGWLCWRHERWVFPVAEAQDPLMVDKLLLRDIEAGEVEHVSPAPDARGPAMATAPGVH